MAPTMPPMQWTPEDIQAVVVTERSLNCRAEEKQIGLTTRPRMIEPMTPEKPQAGVMATRPATTPDAMPSAEGLPFTIHSTSVHDRPAAQVAMNVLMNGTPANWLTSRFEPTLKPNQPTHRRAAPIMVITSECGGIGSLP